MRALKLLFALVFVVLMLGGCGGGGGSGGAGTGTANSGTAADYFLINGARHSENSIVSVEGYVDQTSRDAFQFGGQVGVVSMFDTQTGKQMYLQLAGTADGFTGTYNIIDGTTVTDAVYVDPSAASGVITMAPIGSGTGGSITVSAFGNVGQPITGSFSVNLCDISLACSTGLKNYTGSFSAIRTPNYGSISWPARLSPSLFGISPITGKNYYTIGGFSTASTLTLTLTPSVDVNMAVFSDAGFSSPVTCDVASTLNVSGSDVETCALTVAANQRIYMTVSQAATAVASETYKFNVVRN